MTDIPALPAPRAEHGPDAPPPPTSTPPLRLTVCGNCVVTGSPASPCVACHPLKATNPQRFVTPTPLPQPPRFPALPPLENVWPQAAWGRSGTGWLRRLKIRRTGKHWRSPRAEPTERGTALDDMTETTPNRPLPLIAVIAWNGVPLFTQAHTT
jgi:hypothetical protein